MDWILILAIATFVLVLAFLLWNRVSTRRHQELGGKAEGIGGRNDPLSGNSEGMRPANELQASLDNAALKSADAPVKLTER